MRLLGPLEQRKQDRYNFFRGDPAVQVFLGQDKLLSAKRPTGITILPPALS